MRKNLQILVIDDDLISRKCIKKALDDQYEVYTAVDGVSGIQEAKDKLPDIIFLDVEMPGINGFETCDQLKGCKSTAAIPVVFLSARGSLRERMLGYEVGAVDYFIKPFDKAELLARLAVLLSYQERHEVLLDKFQDASNTAMTAMKGSGELGQIMSFVEKSYTIEKFPELAYAIFQTLRVFSLNVCCVFRGENETSFYSSSGEIKPLEKELIQMLFDEHRFHDFGRRTQINYPNISILIKNMPLEDMERYGRYKDLIIPMLTAADDRITIIDAHKALYDQTQSLNKSMDVVKATLGEVTQSIQDNQSMAAKLMQLMMAKLEERIPSMGMDDDQEKFVISTVEDCVQEVISLQEKGADDMNSFNIVLKAVQHLANKQNKLIKSVFIRDDAVDHLVKPGQNDTNDLGVDLF
ncbi:MAG: response regulator [Bermanella sp.]